VAKLNELRRRLTIKTPLKRISEIPGDVDDYYDTVVKESTTQRYNEYIKNILIKFKEMFVDDINIDIRLEEIKEKVYYDEGDYDWDEDDWNPDTEAVQVTYFFHHTVVFFTDKDINFLKLKYPSNFTADGFKCDELWEK
jgi:hypothetical protein